MSDFSKDISITAAHGHPPAMPDESAPLLRDDDSNNRRTVNGDTDLSRLTARNWILIGMLSCSGFLNIFTAQSTILMLPSISVTYDIPASRQQLVMSIYNISSGCLILLWARLADIYGRGLIFICGSTAYTFATTLLPFSPDETIFYIARAVQGISVAAAVPSSIGILTSTFPAGKRRNYAFVFYNAASSLGAVAGHVFGGIIGGYLSWRWVFWSAALLGALVTFAACMLLSLGHDRTVSTRDTANHRPFVDWVGGAMITASLMILLFTLSGAEGWKGIRNITQIITSGIFASGFILWQRRLETGSVRQPLIRLSVFHNLRFSAALVTYACFLASFNTFLVFASIFFQQYLGLTVLETTWRFIPSGISCFLVSFVVAPALSAIPGFYLLILSIACNIISPLLFALPIPPKTSYWIYGFPAMCLTVSLEILAPVLALFVVQCLPQGDQALGGGLLQTANNVGKAIGLAIATNVQTAVAGNSFQRGDPAFLMGLRAGQWVNVGLSFVTLIIPFIFFRGLKRL